MRKDLLHRKYSCRWSIKLPTSHLQHIALRLGGLGYVVPVWLAGHIKNNDKSDRMSSDLIQIADGAGWLGFVALQSSEVAACPRLT